MAIAAINPVLGEFWNRRLGAPPITADNLIQAVVLGIGITVLSGVLPARAATRVTPMEALRPSVIPTEKRDARRRDVTAVVFVALATVTLASGNPGLALLGALLFLVGLILAAPSLVNPLASLFSRAIEIIYAREGHIARGNVTRQPGRAAVTASTVMIALAIIVGAGGMLSSIFSSIWSYSNKSLGADYLIMPSSLVLSGGNVGAGPQFADALRKTPGVAAATTLRLATSSANDQALQLIGIDPISYPQIAGLVFGAGNESEAYKALGSGRGIIGNGIFAAQSSL